MDLNREELKRLNILLEHRDEIKGFLIMLNENDEVRPSTLTDAGKLTMMECLKLSLIRLVTAKDRGFNVSVLVLTDISKRLLEEFLSQWVDDLQYYAEVEGEGEALTKQAPNTSPEKEQN